MSDRTIVQHPNGYSGVLMGKSTMMIYDKDDNCVLHTCFRTPNTEKELYEVLETMPRFIEILASVDADRKTENSSEKPNNSTISKMEQVETMSCQECNRWIYDDRWGWFCPLKGQDECKYEPKDEPQTEREGE